MVRAYRRVTALGESADANVAHERRYLDYYFLEDCFELHGRLTTEDALRDLAEDWLQEHKSSSRANSYEVIVHVEADALGSDAPGARCEIDGAGAIAPETARRLTCDSSLVGLLETDGEPLSIGRRSRRVPHGLRRALEARDRSCRFPGCASLARLDSHHVEHWTKDDGPTELANLALL